MSAFCMLMILRREVRQCHDDSLQCPGGGCWGKVVTFLRPIWESTRGIDYVWFGTDSECPAKQQEPL